VPVPVADPGPVDAQPAATSAATTVTRAIHCLDPVEGGCIVGRWVMT